MVGYLSYLIITCMFSINIVQVSRIVANGGLATKAKNLAVRTMYVDWLHSFVTNGVWERRSHGVSMTVDPSDGIN